MECFINPGIVRITVIEVPIIEDSLYMFYFVYHLEWGQIVFKELFLIDCD